MAETEREADRSAAVELDAGSEVFVVGGAARVFHRAPDGEEFPPCRADPDDLNETWARRLLRDVRGDLAPCPYCFDVSQNGRRCPLCGSDVASLPEHLGAPAGQGCPETPLGFEDGGETPR